MKSVTLLLFLMTAALPASAQETFDLKFDHTTLLVEDLDVSAAFYQDILHLAPLDTPWGPAAPVRFYSLGETRQLHIGLSAGTSPPDKKLHLAFAIANFDEYLLFLRERQIAYTDFPGNSSEPQVRPDGVRQVYLQDPDGNWIEINDSH